MADEIKIRQAKKIEGKPAKVGQSKKPGPMKEVEVEGQSSWVLVECPWCGGMVWAWDTADYDTWSCAWCGGLFGEV